MTEARLVAHSRGKDNDENKVWVEERILQQRANQRKICGTLSTKRFFSTQTDPVSTDITSLVPGTLKETLASPLHPLLSPYYAKNFLTWQKQLLFKSFAPEKAVKCLNRDTRHKRITDRALIVDLQ